jgi:hypothetical protein
MKKLLIICAATMLVWGCTNSAESKDGGAADTTKMAATKPGDAKLPEMAFPLDRPYANWQTGDPQHAANVMKGLKAFESGDINSCMDSFGDSVRVGFDYYQAKLSKDSLKSTLTHQRAMYSSIKVKMDDWESVISADKKDEWVTLWYHQYQTDKKGNTDSLGVVDDLKIMNGKIVVLDEKIQHLGPPKK